MTGEKKTPKRRLMKDARSKELGLVTGNEDSEEEF